MSFDDILTSLVLIAVVMVIILVAKKTWDICHRRIKLRHELVENDNPAVALALCGYLFGTVFAIAGIMSGEDLALVDEIIDLSLYGLLAIVLLNISSFISDRLVFHRFDNSKELVDDRNIGLGAVEGAFAAASGLVLYGALLGEGGDIITALVFWLLGQFAFLLFAHLYNLITPFDFVAEIEKNNYAVAFAFAGLLLAAANLIRAATAFDFVSWTENLQNFALIFALGIILFPLLRFITDKCLLPTASLTHELVGQDKPNIGVGLLEASTYIIASLIISWVV